MVDCTPLQSAYRDTSEATETGTRMYTSTELCMYIYIIMCMYIRIICACTHNIWCVHYVLSCVERDLTPHCVVQEGIQEEEVGSGEDTGLLQNDGAEDLVPSGEGGVRGGE